jgi:hypothetical protein
MRQTRRIENRKIRRARFVRQASANTMVGFFMLGAVLAKRFNLPCAALNQSVGL